MKPTIIFSNADRDKEKSYVPQPTVYCESCGERKRDCVCTPSYVYRRKEEDDLPMGSEWMR